MKLSFCLLMSGLCSMMRRASYIVMRLRSWKDLAGRVLFSKSCVWMLVLCFFSFEKYKQIFRNIEKLAKKCVNLKGSIKYIYMHTLQKWKGKSKIPTVRLFRSICSITETNIIEIGKRIKALRRKSNFFKNQIFFNFFNIKNFEKITWTKVS